MPKTRYVKLKRLFCRVFGHNTYTYRRSAGPLGLGGPNTVLHSRCHRCDHHWWIEIPPEGLRFTVLPTKEGEK